MSKPSVNTNHWGMPVPAALTCDYSRKNHSHRSRNTLERKTAITEHCRERQIMPGAEAPNAICSAGGAAKSRYDTQQTPRMLEAPKMSRWEMAEALAGPGRLVSIRTLQREHLMSTLEALHPPSGACVVISSLRLREEKRHTRDGWVGKCTDLPLLFPT